MLDYYDMVLGLIPLSVAGIAGTLLGFGAGLPLAVSVGALFAAGVIGHAMFVRAPVGGSAGSDGSTARGSETASDRYNPAE
jgi:hypothetical protein